MIGLLVLAFQHDPDNGREYLRDAILAEGFASVDTSNEIHRALPYGVRAAHTTDGRIYLDYPLGVAFDAWASGGQLARHIDALRVVVHEELHGVGPATPAAYTGIGITVEEVTSELVAHALLATWGLEAPQMGYADEYARLAHRGLFRRWTREQMTVAACTYKRLPPNSVTSATEAVATFNRLLVHAE